MAKRAATRLFARLTPSTERSLAEVLRTERAGGLLLLIGTVIALVWANSDWSAAYDTMRNTVVGFESLHLDLSLADWAKDGLLAIFFFVVGLELKREIVAGELRRPATAIVPIVAAIGGMVVPALVYVWFNSTHPDGTLAGWAVPTATDIAFAIAILAVVGRWLPNALRAFLLTLAVVDDLLAIVIIAVFFPHGFHLEFLLASIACVGLFWYLLRRRIVNPFILVPLALATWGFMHASGVHATIAGVALGMVVPALKRKGEKQSLAEHWEHLWRPVSAGFAVPVFALFAAGVALNSSALADAFSDPAAQGVALGLVLGKPIGIVVATALVANLTRASLDRGISWWDVLAVSVLAGIGFTVSLLIGDLAFTDDAVRAENVKAAVLIGSVVAAIIGASLLAWRDKFYRELYTSRSTPTAAEKEQAHAEAIVEDDAQA